MNLNEFSANIQYENSVITECNFENNILDIGSDAELQTAMQVAVSNPVIDEEAQKKYGRVRLTIEGNYSVQGNDDATCKYRVVLIGKFSASVQISDDDFLALLWFNGSTALYSIARGKVETISSAILNNGKIVLPMVNMAELLKAQSEETKE